MAGAPPMASVFGALGDPVRLGLLERLAEAPATATTLAAELPITRQAVAKHLARLENAELLRRERRGREAVYSVRPEPLVDAASWCARVGDEWDARLKRLERSLRD